jgi:shikimate 5-dehydrogenase
MIRAPISEAEMELLPPMHADAYDLIYTPHVQLNFANCHARGLKAIDGLGNVNQSRGGGWVVARAACPY